MITYSIIQKPQLEGARRLDAEYYQPDYLVAKNVVLKMPHKELGQLIDKLTDYHANGSYELLRKNVSISPKRDYALMVRAVDFEKNDFENDVRYVSEKAYKFLKKTQIFGDELLIDKIGKAGEVFFMPNLHKPVTLGMNLFMLRLKDFIDPAYVYLFLLSKHGKSLITQKITGTAPLSIDKNSVRDIVVPIPSLENQRGYRVLLENSINENENSKDLYEQAENLLLQELGFVDFQITEDLTFGVNFSELKNAGRMDADYFQPKYEELVKRIKKSETKKLGEIVSLKKGVEPGSEAYQEEGKLFIRVSSLSKNGIEQEDQKYLSDELYQQLKTTYEPKVGEILLTKDASPGIAYVVKEQIEGIISGGILRLKTKIDIDAEYLALCINSMLGQMQIEQSAGGSIIEHWKPEQVKELIVPILSPNIQQQIGDLVKKSHEARKKSKELLEQAKRQVEEMIERGG